MAGDVSNHGDVSRHGEYSGHGLGPSIELHSIAVARATADHERSRSLPVQDLPKDVQDLPEGVRFVSTVGVRMLFEARFPPETGRDPSPDTPPEPRGQRLADILKAAIASRYDFEPGGEPVVSRYHIEPGGEPVEPHPGTGELQPGEGNHRTWYHRDYRYKPTDGSVTRQEKIEGFRETSLTESGQYDRQITELVTRDGETVVYAYKPGKNNEDQTKFAVEQEPSPGSASSVSYTYSVHFADGTIKTTIGTGSGEILHRANPDGTSSIKESSPLPDDNDLPS